MSIIKKSQFKIDNENYRFDSDFFKKEFIGSEQIIKSKEWDYLGILSKQIINFGAYSLCNFIEFFDEGVPYLNVADIKPNKISYNQAKKINKDLSKKTLWKSLAKNNQVLLTIAGTIGNAAVAYKLPAYTNSNQAIANIETKNLNPFYLSVYLNSYYGRQQTKKLTISSVQPNLLLTQVKKIKVYIPSSDFQKFIESKYKHGFNTLETSQNLYSEAENLLLEELDIKDWQPKTENTSTKTFAQSFGTSGRLDAEYYQPKYDEINEKIKQTEYYRLEELVTIIKSIEPGSAAYQDKGIPFVRVSNLTKFGISKPDIYISENLVSKELQPKKDTILLTKDGTIGIAYKVEEDLKMVTSSAILHLTIKDKEKVNPDYLTLVLNSIITKMQAERDAGGSIIKHWRIKEIEKILIPIIDFKIQKVISIKIQESFKLKNQSEQLLEIAKTGVEKAIEGNEEVAIKWIKAELEKIKITLTSKRIFHAGN